jgi:hypothetical protein
MFTGKEDLRAKALREGVFTGKEDVAQDVCDR